MVKHSPRCLLTSARTKTADAWRMVQEQMHHFKKGSLPLIIHVSATFNAAEKNYSQIENVALAFIFAEAEIGLRGDIESEWSNDQIIQKPLDKPLFSGYHDEQDNAMEPEIQDDASYGYQQW